MRANRWGIAIAALCLIFGAGLRVSQAQGGGGVFLPSFNYVITGFWNFTHSGGTIGTNTGPAAFKINGTAVYEVSEGGNVALGGSNPTSVTMTPLARLDGCTITTMGTAAPGLDPIAYSVVTTASAGRLDIYAWQATSTGNPTLIASTSTRQVQYTCVGR